MAAFRFSEAHLPCEPSKVDGLNTTSSATGVTSRSITSESLAIPLLLITVILIPVIKPLTFSGGAIKILFVSPAAPLFTFFNLLVSIDHKLLPLPSESPLLLANTTTPDLLV